MKLTSDSTDGSILHEVGYRLAAVRLDRNLTQTSLAREAGISKSTVERLESGQHATRLSAFIRICRVLGLVERLDAFLPEPTPSPIAQLQLQGRRRKRASGKRKAAGGGKKWAWGEPS